MADALVSVILELGSTVLDGLEQEVSLVAGVKKKIKHLTKTLTIIKGVLEDADEKQVKNEAVKFWLADFKDISYDAEDILDEWRTRSRILHMEQSDPVIKKKVQSKLFNLLSCFCFKHVVIRHEIGFKIKKLNKRLVGVNENIQTYGLRKIQSNDVRRIPSIAVPDVPMIYGRDNEKNILISKLLSESSTVNLHVPVISIVGTGGFGKTTLAQLILKDEKVITNFDKLIWVCVSDPFLVENIAKEIIQQIQQAKGNVPNTTGCWQALHENLSECIKGRRFILVLDDVWSCTYKEWSQLKNALDCGDVRSRIIVTSRSVRLAKMINSSYTHTLRQLSDDDCWSLFKCIAFSGKENVIDTYENIWIKISKKCKGVPLAVRVIASLMCLKTTKEEWHDVLESNIWDVEEEGEGFLPSILLSYNALPSHLKPCLMYCAVLPKDSNLEKEEMVKLWMAQGYLGPGDDGSADLEKKGRDYFDNLAMLSFFQDFKKDDEGSITSCKMHDLVHDFVQFLTKNETIILEEENASSVKVRHLCARYLGWSSIYQQKNLRTLRIHPKKMETPAPELLHQLTCLRALSLCGCGIKELPSEVDKLLHLRYLDLSYNYDLKELPETVCNLVNLQTLNVRKCDKLVRLPKTIAKLSSSLRHLHNEGCDNLKYMLVGVRELRWLRTLDEFIVGCYDEESKERRCTIGELEKLRSLKMIFRREEEVVVGMEGILEDLEPHQNLEKLELNNYKGIRLPNWFSSMSNLTELTLKNLLQCLQLPALGKLESLEVLHLDGMGSIKRIGSEFYGLDNTSNRQVIFPKLRVLVINDMKDCEKWDLPFQNGVDFFPNLIQLKLRKFVGVLPALGKLKSLETLLLLNTDCLKHSFDELLGIPTTASDIVVFPALKSLRLVRMRSWEEEEGCNTYNGITIMPHLEKLILFGCSRLKVIPFYLFSDALRELRIGDCPQLTGMQPSLPPLLEKLALQLEVGVLKNSLPLLHNNNYPNLHYFAISRSSQSSLPRGFNLLTSIRQLKFSDCKILEFEPDELKHLTMLEELTIHGCSELAERFRGGGGEISSSSSHVYNISITFWEETKIRTQRLL